MNFQNTDKSKLILAGSLLAFGTSSVLVGKTMVNVFLLTHYPRSYLALFYLLQALLLMGVIIITGPAQDRKPVSFSFIFKTISISFLLLFSLLFQAPIPGLIFAGCLVIFILSTLTGVLSWFYVSSIFNLIEFKKYFMWFQIISGVSAFLTGAITAYLGKSFDAKYLPLFMALVEILSLLCILGLNSFIPVGELKKNIDLSYSSLFKKHTLIKGLLLFYFITSTVNILVDYILKVNVMASVEKSKMTEYISTLMMISSIFVAIFASMNSFLLKTLGSKRIIALYPFIILLSGTAVLLIPNIGVVSFLFCIENILSNTTSSLSNNLYLNTLPSLVKNKARLILSGILKPISITLCSVLILFIEYVNNMTLPVYYITLACLMALLISRFLMKNYSKELGRSLFLRRYSLPEKTDASNGDEQAESVINKAFESHDFELLNFGVQLLKTNSSLPCPLSIANLLTVNDSALQTEAARLISMHPEQKEFFKTEYDLFLKTENVLTKWYFAVYLTRVGNINLIPYAKELLMKTNVGLQAIATLILLKQGIGSEKNAAISLIEKLYRGETEEELKWFLLILAEYNDIDKEHYLVTFIKNPNVSIQKLALQQVEAHMSPTVIDAVFSQFDKKEIFNQVTEVIIKLGSSVFERIEHIFLDTESYRKKPPVCTSL